MRKIWMRLLAGCLALLVNLTTSSAVWAASPKKAEDAKFQGVPLQCYLSLADASTNSPEAKVAAYTEIAGKYLELQHPEQAKKVLEKSLTAANAIATPSLKAFALLDTAGRLTKAAQPKMATDALDSALAIAKALPDPVDKVFANIKIAQAYGDAGKKEKAQNLLADATKATPEIIDAYVRSRAFAAIANIYTELGDDFNSEASISAATDLLPMIEDRNIKARARVEITGSYAQAGNHPKAVASLAAVFQEFDAIRDNAIASAKETAKNSQVTSKKSAPKVATKALKKDDSQQEKASSAIDPKAVEPKAIDPKAVEQSAIANAELLKTRSLFLVANQYLVSKQYDKALEVINNLDSKSVEKSVGIANVAIAYAKDQQIDQASKLLDQSLQGLSAVAPSIDVATLLVEVGRQYHQTIKAPELAVKAWDQALAIAQKLTQPAERLFALNSIASTYGEFGLAEKAAPILQESFAIAKTALDANIRSRVFSDISSTYWAIGDQDKAKEIAKDIENPTEKEQLNKLFACAS